MFQTIILGLNAILFMLVAHWSFQDEDFNDPMLSWGIGVYALVNLLAAFIK